METLADGEAAFHGTYAGTVAGVSDPLLAGVARQLGVSRPARRGD